VDKLVVTRPISDWRVYLKWHVLHAAAPFLCSSVENESFNFFGKVSAPARAGAALETRLSHLDHGIGESRRPALRR